MAHLLRGKNLAVSGYLERLPKEAITFTFAAKLYPRVPNLN